MFTGVHRVYEIHELFFQGTWKHTNLTTDAISADPSRTRVPPAAGDPIGYAWWADDDGQQHVVYRGTDCHIHELFFQLGSQWKHNDLTVQAGNPPPASGDPSGYTWGGDEGQHIVYRQS